MQSTQFTILRPATERISGDLQNTFLIANQKEKGKYQIMSRYTYRTDPRVTFNSRNSNYEKAKQMSELTIRKLKKQRKLKEFQDPRKVRYRDTPSSAP